MTLRSKLAAERALDGEVADAKFFSGTDAPAAGLGKVGDLYLKTDTKAFYVKTASDTWTSIGTLN